VRFSDHPNSIRLTDPPDDEPLLEVSTDQGALLDMPTACTHASHMSKMVQIRNVPEALHRKLKVRAADLGQTLSDYLLAELERLAARPTREEMLTRIHGRKRVTLKTPAAVVIREERESA
jgi:antitoxin FitA